MKYFSKNWMWCGQAEGGVQWAGGLLCRVIIYSRKCIKMFWN